jgi:hypothetical protein
MPVVMFLTKLKEGADREKYEKWVREFDYASVDKYSKTIQSYTTHKVNEISRDDSPYEYYEVIRITDIEDYKKEMQEPWAQEVLKQFAEFIDMDKVRIVYTDPI